MKTKPQPPRPSVRRPDPPAAAPAAAPLTPVDQPQRLAVTLTPDGSAIDWSRMREGTKSKLLDLAKRDERLRPATVDTTPASDVFSAEWCAMIYDALGTLERTIVQRVYKVSAAQAESWTFTDEDKRILTGPTKKVLNKYAARWLTSNTDEVALLLTLATVHLAKVQQLRDVVERDARPRSPAPVVVEWPVAAAPGPERLTMAEDPQ